MLSNRRLMFVLTTIFILCFGSQGVSTHSMAKFNCSDTCANVTIPYPFGIGEGCFKDKWFEITCEVGPSGSEVPILRSYQLKVLRINFHKLRVAFNWTFPSCHPDDSGTELRVKPVNYDTGTFNPFLISPTLNRFIGEGCGIFAYVTNKRDTNTTMYTDGCVSLCTEKTMYEINPSILSRTCLGIGCCQASIPAGLRSMYIHIFHLQDNSSDPWGPSSCSRAFVTEKGFSAFRGVDEMPMSMSWVAGNTTCEQIAGSASSDQPCGKNAHCTDYLKTEGHRCQCNPGFDGNPYLPEGCQGILSLLIVCHLDDTLSTEVKMTIKTSVSLPDVDECLDPNNRCQGVATCVNTIGDYYCICPSGANASSYNGTCVPNPNDKLKTAESVYLGMGVVTTICSNFVLLKLETDVFSLSLQVFQ